MLSLLGGGKGTECEVSIRGGYPGLIDRDPDGRDVKGLKDALEKTGKLTADE